jgi:hypothetical protein
LTTKQSGMVALLVAASLSPACSRDPQAIAPQQLQAGAPQQLQAITPQQLQQRYGITNAYTGQVRTPDGSLRGTLVPVTLPDGSRAELVIPDGQANEPHPMYFQDAQGFHPVEVQDNTSREQLTSAPLVVNRRAERAHPRQRSWEKEALIIGGGAGAGAAIGALTGGKKGAGIGAGAGGVGGLIYDLATRKKQ